MFIRRSSFSGRTRTENATLRHPGTCAGDTPRRASAIIEFAIFQGELKDAERRYGGVADDEMLLAMSTDEFARCIEGLEALSKRGLRYPIPPYGAQMEPAFGMAVSYPGGSQKK